MCGGGALLTIILCLYFLSLFTLHDIIVLSFNHVHVHVCVLELVWCVLSKLIQNEDAYGDTLLIRACRRGDVKTARVLLDHGASPDYQNKV